MLTKNDITYFTRLKIKTFLTVTPSLYLDCNVPKKPETTSTVTIFINLALASVRW